MIWPIAFFATASGLMMDKVCSTAMNQSLNPLGRFRKGQEYHGKALK
jgi:hypothetical protein